MTTPAIVTMAFKSGGRPGFSRSDYEVGRIVPRPSAEEQRALFERGRAEPLADFWQGDFPKEPLRVEGKLFPCLLTRPASGQLYVWIEVHLLRPLGECARSDQMEAVRRCCDAAQLAAVARFTSDNAVRSLARQRSAAEVAGSTAVSLEVVRGRAVVCLANGAEASTHNYYAKDLAPLAAAAGPDVLAALEKGDGRPAVQALVAELRAAPAAPPATVAPPDDEAHAGFAAAEVSEFLGTFPELLTGDQAEALATFFEVPDRALAGWLKDGSIAGAAKTGTARNATWAIPKAALVARIEEWAGGQE